MGIKYWLSTLSPTSSYFSHGKSLIVVLILRANKEKLVNFAFLCVFLFIVALTSVGCFVEDFYDRLFYKVYLDYRSQINRSAQPDTVIQACAKAAVARRYTYFAITNYGVCKWGPNGHTVSSTRQKAHWCYRGLGAPWLISVYMVGSSSGGMYSLRAFHCFSPLVVIFVAVTF